jgi:hypothetical protein
MPLRGVPVGLNAITLVMYLWYVWFFRQYITLSYTVGILSVFNRKNEVLLSGLA